MKTVYFANGIRGRRCLEAMLAAQEEVVAVVGHPGEKAEVLCHAEEAGLATYQPEKVNSPAFVAEMRRLEPDLFVLSGYNRILRPEIIALPALGCINLHGGRLPEYRGCAPINWQIINGETVGGCCVLFVDEGIDTGDIISQAYYDILDTDTSQDIVNKQLELFPAMLLQAMSDIRKGVVKATPQDKTAGCYYTRRYPRDGLIRWDTMGAAYVCNLVRSLADPYPNAFTFYRGKKVRIRKARRLSPSIKGVPGRLPLKRPEGIVVCCGDEAILVTEVALEDSGTPDAPNNMFPIGADFNSVEKGI